MPTILRLGPYRFHFYSDELKEPPHIHVETPEGECKFCLNRSDLPEIAVFPHVQFGRLKNWFLSIKLF